MSIITLSPMNASTRKLLDIVEEAVRQGRLENAVQILSGQSAPQLASDMTARRLITDVADQLQTRFHECVRIAAWRPATDQLRLLRQLAGETQQLSRLRNELQAAVEVWILKQSLAGNFEDVEASLDAMISANMQSDRLRQMHLNVLAIRSAQKLAALGRFAEAESQIATVTGNENLIDAKNEIEKIQLRHQRAKPILVGLHKATAEAAWSEVARQSELLLQQAARHPLALQMRERAAFELRAQGKPHHAYLEPTQIVATKMNQHPSTHIAVNVNNQKSNLASAPSDLPILWIDGVGGYIICDIEEFVIGQAIPSNSVDLGIVGDLSRRAAMIRRAGDDFLLHPLHLVTINNTRIDRASLMNDGDEIRLGQRVEIKVRKPSRLSATTQLKITSSHRWHSSVEGVLLMGESCILGPTNTSHILCPFWSSDVILFKNKNQWMCRCEQPLEVDGRETKDAVPLLRGKRIRGTDFSMTLE